MMEWVEDIPADAILAGLPWDWETYGEYLDASTACPRASTSAAWSATAPCASHAMGERSLDEAPATADDIAAMCELVDEAIGAGALGFSTSRTLLHRVPDGRPVPGTWADDRRAARHRRRARAATAGACSRPRPASASATATTCAGTRAEVGWMGEVSSPSGRPVTFGLAQTSIAAPTSTPR